MFKVWRHWCKLSWKNVREHYRVWHNKPRCLSSLWFVAFYESVVMWLFRMTYSRWMHNVPYCNSMPYTSCTDRRNLGHILQLLRVYYYLRLEIAQWLQSQCESPGDVMKRPVIYCSSCCQRCEVYKQSATCGASEGSDKSTITHTAWVHCLIIVLEKGIFWHGWHGQSYHLKFLTMNSAMCKWVSFLTLLGYKKVS